MLTAVRVGLLQPVVLSSVSTYKVPVTAEVKEFPVERILPPFAAAYQLSVAPEGAVAVIVPVWPGQTDTLFPARGAWGMIQSFAVRISFPEIPVSWLLPSATDELKDPAT